MPGTALNCYLPCSSLSEPGSRENRKPHIITLKPTLLPVVYAFSVDPKVPHHPRNSTISCRPSVQTHESMGSTFIYVSVEPGVVLTCLT